jgi:alkylated DNA nucleotide flippase Atl1
MQNKKEQLIKVLVEQASLNPVKAFSYGYIGSLIGLSGFVTGKILNSFSEKEMESYPWYLVVNKQGYLSTLKLGFKGLEQKQLLQNLGITVEEDYVIKSDLIC